MADLSEEQRNHIRQSCIATFNHYLINADHHVDRFTETFTDDVTWVRPSGTMTGHGEMQAFMDANVAAQRAGNPHGHVTRHLLTTADVEVRDADHAEGTFYALVFRDEGFGGTLPVPMTMPELVVEYRSCFLRTSAGWLIRARGFSATSCM
jgi:hypothetical protein